MAVSRVQSSSILQGFPKSRSLLAGNAGYDPAATWLIQRITAAGGETSITFSSIPQTYTSLQIRIMSKDTYSTSALASQNLIQFNSDTAANYAYHTLTGNGTAAAAGGTTAASNMIAFGNADSATGQTSTFGAAIIDIQDYNLTSKNKTIRTLSGANWNTTSTNQRIALTSGLWLSTAAVTSITILKDLTAFAAGSTFALYGMK